MGRSGGSDQPVKARRANGPKNRKASAGKASARKVSTAAPSVGELQKQIDILTGELKEANERQAAATEVLQIINSSAGELAPVFATILEKARSLCGVAQGTLQLYDGSKFRAVAMHGLSAALAALLREGVVPGPNTPHRQLLEGARFAQVTDWAEIDHPIARASLDAGIRTTLYIPLRRKEMLLGYIAAARREVRPFAEKEIALLENFASQAVIAMENARLFEELRNREVELARSVDELTATGDVLKIISRSTFDLETVLEAVTSTALRLCEADMGFVSRREGEHYRFLMGVGSTAEQTADALRLNNAIAQTTRRFVAGQSSITGRVVQARQPVQIADITVDPEYSVSEANTIAKTRTILGVPMLREGEPIGTFTLTRQRVEPFTDRQIDVVRTFADQAAIAIENARLFEELRQRTDDLSESLQQQTATAEVLQVINSSPGDLAPVFETILEKAHKLCDVALGTLLLYDGEKFCAVAVRGLSEAFAAYLREGVVADPTLPHYQLLGGARFAQVADWVGIDHPLARGALDAGIGTTLYIPLRREGQLLGYIAAARREVRPFAEKEIALLEAFAAQAVIAMENARLFEELRDRQAELRATFDNMGDGVAMFGADTRLAAWNRNFQTILDVPDELAAQRPTYADFVRILAQRGEFGTVDIEEELNRRLQGTDEELRLERTRPDGRVIEVRRSTVPGGGFVLIYGDITERKRAEQAIRAARDAAEIALRDLQSAQASLVHAQKMAALGQLTAGIAHEIKNPLNFVNNFAGLSVELLDELKQAAAQAIGALDTDKRAEILDTIGMLTGNLERIAEHGRRADGIVRGMLQHSRGSSGDWHATDMNALVEESLNLAYHGARAQDRDFNVALELDLDRDLVPIEIVSQDVSRMLLNLISNGFYAVTQRGREVDGAFRPALKIATREFGEGIEIRVRDNGVGIAPEYWEKLFQPFFTTKPTGEGTGLGLSISYEIVTQQHGGTITVDSEPNDFTEFTVRLPRRRRATVR